MGAISEFTLPVQLFLRAYRWRQIDPVPWTPLDKKLEECRVALVSTAGLITAEQQPFDRTTPGGDVSCREIPDDIALDSLQETHRSRSWDRTGMTQDRNLVLPIDRLHELAARGRVASVNRRHYSLMGSITVTGPLLKRTAPVITGAFSDDGVDVVLLVPV